MKAVDDAASLSNQMAQASGAHARQVEDDHVGAQIEVE